ncbi:MAG TPA: hypothetical protein ENK66_07680 [Arcobacter sp.]|nr:hypothetical protein [Arcobacter sp.]
MELLTLKITPLSSFATIPKGDTLFGQILSYLFLKGDMSFENYLNEEPKLIVSDMMPFGYVYKPTLPLDCFKNNEQEVDKKDIRKREYITIENLQKGDLHLCEKVDYIQKETAIKNSINRATFTTDGDEFAPYGNIEINFTKQLWMFVLVKSDIKTKIIDTIREIGIFGFGKESNTGKGAFDIELMDTTIKSIDTNYFMSISPTIIKDENFDNVWYEPFTRFGKYGLSNAHTNAFKKPLLMADSAMVVKSKQSKTYFGKSVDNGVKDKPSFVQGYSIAVPFMIRDAKCLDTK